MSIYTDKDLIGTEVRDLPEYKHDDDTKDGININKNIVAFIALLLSWFVLIYLSYWQVQRYYDKVEKHNFFDKQHFAPTLEVDCSDTDTSMNKDDLEKYLYRQIKITGKISDKDIIYLYHKDPRMFFDGTMGYQILALMQCNKDTLLIDLGWITENKIDDDVIIPKPNTIITVDGNIRRGKTKTIFNLSNNFKNNKMYWLSIAELAEHHGVELASYYIKSKQNIGTDNLPLGSVPRNYIQYEHHLYYAFMWFLTAFCVFTMYIMEKRHRARY